LEGTSIGGAYAALSLTRLNWRCLVIESVYPLLPRLRIRASFSFHKKSPQRAGYGIRRLARAILASRGQRLRVVRVGFHPTEAAAEAAAAVLGVPAAAGLVDAVAAFSCSVWHGRPPCEFDLVKFSAAEVSKR
jgi:hypothetical protein